MGESLKELPFLLFIPYFFVPLTFGRRYFRSKMKRKTSFPFAFCSLFRTFVAEFNKKKNMGIKRDERFIELQLRPTINKENMFSYLKWKHAINWDLMLAQIKKTENACQLIDANLYPSRLFPLYIDIMEANLYILDDMFYDQTGIRIGHKYDSSSFFDIDNLKFWNMDCYQKIKMSIEGIDRIVIHLMNLSKQIPLLDISHSVIDSVRWDYENNKKDPPAFVYNDIYKESLCHYAYEPYWESTTDEKSLQNQYIKILDFLDNYRSLFRFLIDLTVRDCDFEDLLTSFRQGVKGQEFIKPWRHDFEGSRDSLIAKMEKDPELEPWVNKYTHRREDKSIFEHLFCDENWHIKNEEEVYNTDNWIRILTIAAVLQEYDEQQNAVVEKSEEEREGEEEEREREGEEKGEEKEEEAILLKLSLYFKDEDASKRFLNSVRQMNDREIITLLKKYRDGGLCTDTSKNLWMVLHDANLYKASYKNWNAQLNKR